MLLAIFSILALALTITAFLMRSKPTELVILGMFGTFAWLVFSGVSYTTQTGMTDPYFYSFLFGIAMTITMPIATWELYHHASIDNQDYNDDREWKHKERSEPKASIYSAADRLRLKHGMRLSSVARKRQVDKDTGWDD